MNKRQSLNLLAAIMVSGCQLGCLGGCIGKPQDPAATQPATAVDPATTQPSYWLGQPAAATVTAGGFEPLWEACKDVAREHLFRLDRTDYRAGVLTTKPMVSGQFFEPWRRELKDADDVAESSTATIRRTVRFEIGRRDDGTFAMVPKVLVERQALAERRITSVVLYRGAFGRKGETRAQPSGTRESDQGIILPAKYWYPIGRDGKLEKALADAVERRLSRSASR